MGVVAIEKRVIDPRKQFSKKLAWYTMWFWFAYMIGLELMMAYQPAIASQNVILALLVTVTMFGSVYAYTGNSKYEKGLYATVQVAQINAKALAAKAKATEDPDESEEQEDDPEEPTEETEEGGEG